MEKAVNYANECEVFGRPIDQNQGVQFAITRAYAEYRAADLMLVRAVAALFHADQVSGEKANLARMVTSEASWNSEESCMKSRNGYGIAREFNIERKRKATRLSRIAHVSTSVILV